MKLLLSVAVAVLAGSMLPLQAAFNARLAKAVGSPIWAAAISGLVLTGLLALVACLTFRGHAREGSLSDLPWWAWAGGIGGALLLSATATLTPRLGSASLIALVMAGQVICSLVMDSYGLFGLPIHPLSLKRVLAGLLLLGGASLMR